MEFVNALSAVNTENGAASHGSTGSSRVDFFFKVLRSTPEGEVQRLVSRSYAENENDTGKLVFHLRDCRGGKGERKPFIECLKWYLNTGKVEFVREHLGLIPFYGYWKDLDNFFGTAVENDVVKLYANVLRSDLERMKAGKSISLAGKWAPSEGAKVDRAHNAADKITKELFPEIRRYSSRMQLYRKVYLSKLRKYSNVTEVYMCGKLWDQINYEQVPSVCMLKHRKAFSKNDEQRFKEYLDAVKAGEKKINATQLFPHELISHYLKGGSYDETVEAQWKALVAHHRKIGTFENCLPVCDVSGSMTAKIGDKSNVSCLEACMGLGMLISECIEGAFSGVIVTFSSKPEFHVVKGKTLQDRVRDVKSMHWEMTTNFQAVFDMILDRCTKHNVPQDKCPKTIFTFSDMQFNEARYCPEHHNQSSGWGYGGKCDCPSGRITNLEAIRQKYSRSKYEMPGIVFWNLRGNTPDFPATTEDSGIALVSGFSPTLMGLFMKGVELNPYNIMRVAIDDERYSLICAENSEQSDVDGDVLYRGKKRRKANSNNEDDEEVKVVKI